MEALKKLAGEFADTTNPPKYKHYIGWFTATSLTGFIAGMIVASLMWFTAYYIRYML